MTALISDLFMIAIVSRMVIQLGISPEKSFALSDYFVYTVEEKKNRTELEALVDDMISSYSDLLRAESVAAYSQKITKALFYIQEHVYEPCTVSEVADYLQLNPRYFAALFKKETGMSPQFISNEKRWRKPVICSSTTVHYRVNGIGSSFNIGLLLQIRSGLCRNSISTHFFG